MNPSTPDIAAIEALLEKRAYQKQALEKGPPLSWDCWARQISETEAQLLEIYPALLSTVRELQEAARWHYPDSEAETEKLPLEGVRVLVEFKAEDRLSEWTVLGSYKQDRWHQEHSPVRRTVKRWKYIGEQESS